MIGAYKERLAPRHRGAKAEFASRREPSLGSTEVPPYIAIPASHFVMPGLVPGIHVLRHRGAGRERARRRRDVDGRNKSGHDGERDAGVPNFVCRIAQSAANPLVLELFARTARIKPDSSGLVPGIHVLRHRVVSGDKRTGQPTWMPGTSPGMTTKGAVSGERPPPPAQTPVD